MKKYGLLGRKLGHSLSPQIHAQLGDYPYELYCRELDELDDFFADESIDGFNVTIPYKIEAYNRCDVLSETAKATGSVNTVTKKDGKLYGDNTDVFGLEFSAKKFGLELKGKKVVILGNGGATLSVKYVAEKNGAKEIIVVSRSGENNYENLSKHYDAQVIYNATPVGMFPNNGNRLIDLSKFENLEFVYDLIYNPLKTQLMIDAEELNIPHCNGLMMLVSQAFKTAEIFTGEKLDFELNDKIYKNLMNEQKNIVLVGMPGCGKSTIGKLVAEKLGRKFIDTDEEIVKKDGRIIPDIFKENGEQFFRDVETEVIKDFGKQLSQVISTGGGSILRKENRNALSQNATVVYLKRDLYSFDFGDRPLLKSKEDIDRLYKERKPIYEEIADVESEVGADLDENVRRVIECVFS